MIKEYFFNIEWSKRSLIQFLAHVPAECYYLIGDNPANLTGLIVGTEIMEFLTNEIPFVSITYLTKEEFLGNADFEQRNYGNYPR